MVVKLSKTPLYKMKGKVEMYRVEEGSVYLRNYKKCIDLCKSPRPWDAAGIGAEKRKVYIRTNACVTSPSPTLYFIQPSLLVNKLPTGLV